MSTQRKPKAVGGQIAEAVTYRLDLYEQALHGAEPTDLHALVIGEAEKALIQWTMVAVEHNQSRAAEWLGISRPTLRAMLAKYGIQQVNR
ncbi:helix-turn-helix domain-containing protein [Paraburkholderia bannensis]|uniref:helix-turn-helix domain-containing protein n=1 Tax=Paraburkholderia bannensis TaxID=765414 RepID=UPI00048953C4|nr:helix-turn-helix domain-containing protein [Paraburkholderia bannensis]